MERFDRSQVAGCGWMSESPAASLAHSIAKSARLNGAPNVCMGHPSHRHRAHRVDHSARPSDFPFHCIWSECCRKMVPLLLDRDDRDAVGLWRAGRYARPADRCQFAYAVSRNHGARPRIIRLCYGCWCWALSSCLVQLRLRSHGQLKWPEIAIALVTNWLQVKSPGFDSWYGRAALGLLPSLTRHASLLALRPRQQGRDHMGDQLDSATKQSCSSRHQ